MKRYFLSIAAFFIFNCSFAQSDSLLLIKELKDRYIAFHLNRDDEDAKIQKALQTLPEDKEIGDRVTVELFQRKNHTNQDLERLVSTMSESGGWNDIDYDSKNRSGWFPKEHPERLLVMAKAYHRLHDDGNSVLAERIKKALHDGIMFWIDKKLVSPNWWHNEIGVPKTMGLVFLLFENEMTPFEKAGSIEIMSHSKIGKTGQNKVWLSGNVLVRGLLENKYALVKEARDAISSELTAGNDEGITAEWCFHQHGTQQQLGNYGLSFMLDMSFYNYLFHGTSLSFAPEQSKLLYSLFTESYRWIVWKGYWDVNALNRQLFKNADIQKTLSFAFAVNTMKKNADVDTRRQLDNFLHDNLFSPNSPNRLVGYKHFSLSDYTLYRSHNWMASLKMASNRVIGVEKVNEDNLQGFYMADGALYCYATGNEYHNIFSCWDWRKIPGTTTYCSSEKVPKDFKKARNDASLVAGKQIGNGGFTTMELKKDKLNAFKSWAFTPNFIVCVGSGIKTDSTLSAMTTVDQRLHTSDVLFFENHEWTTLSGTTIQKSGVRRYFHDNTGYVVMEGGPCEAQIQLIQGKWSDVMGIYKPVLVENEIFSLVIKHSASKISYVYVVLPNSTKEQVANFDVKQIKFKASVNNNHQVVIGDAVYSL